MWISYFQNVLNARRKGWQSWSHGDPCHPGAQLGLGAGQDPMAAVERGGCVHQAQAQDKPSASLRRASSSARCLLTVQPSTPSKRPQGPELCQ